MGIRFYCPKGHKLNVKTELAGKVGVCPKCGERMLIPLTSTREGHHPSNDDDLGHPEADSPNQMGEDAVAVETTDFALQEKNVAVFPDSAPVASLPDQSHNDPSLLWYVRGADEQTYGPVAGNIIGQWIQEKRIAPTMFVWHEGWENWAEARTVFPELETLFAAPAVDKFSPEAFPNRSTSANTYPAVSAVQSSLGNEMGGAVNRKKKASRELIFVIGLIVVIVCLIVALIAILVSQKSSDRESSQRLPVPHSRAGSVSSPMPANDATSDWSVEYSDVFINRF